MMSPKFKTYKDIDGALSVLFAQTSGKFWDSASDCNQNKSELFGLSLEILEGLRRLEIRYKTTRARLEEMKRYFLGLIQKLSIHLDWNEISLFLDESLFGKTAETWLRSQLLHLHNRESFARGIAASIVLGLKYRLPDTAGLDSLARGIDDNLFKFSTKDIGIVNVLDQIDYLNKKVGGISK